MQISFTISKEKRGKRERINLFLSLYLKLSLSLFLSFYLNPLLHSPFTSFSLFNLHSLPSMHNLAHFCCFIYVFLSANLFSIGSSFSQSLGTLNFIERFLCRYLLVASTNINVKRKTHYRASISFSYKKI